MIKKIKLILRDLYEKKTDMKKNSEKYIAQLEEKMRTEPFKSAGIIFISGIVLGLLIGISESRDR